jgi:hypothetical protein
MLFQGRDQIHSANKFLWLRYTVHCFNRLAVDDMLAVSGRD